MSFLLATDYLDEQESQCWDDLFTPEIPCYSELEKATLEKQLDFFEACTRDAGYSSGYRIYLPKTDQSIRISGVCEMYDQLPGRWGLVFSNAFGHVHERFVDPETTALEAAVAISTSGYIPKGVDKIFCTRGIGNWRIEETGTDLMFEDIVPLYGTSNSLIPKEALEFCLDTYDDLNEPLHVAPGYVKSLLRPKPECMQRIIENCETVIRCRAGMSLRQTLPLKIIASRRERVGDGEWANAAFGIFKLLCNGLYDTPEIRDVPKGNLAHIRDSRIRRNEFPIQALKATQIKQRYLNAARCQQDVCRIWNAYLDHYGIEISQYNIDGKDLDQIQKKVTRLGWDLGVFPAVEAVLSGVPVEDVLVSLI